MSLSSADATASSKDFQNLVALSSDRVVGYCLESPKAVLTNGFSTETITLNSSWKG